MRLQMNCYSACHDSLSLFFRPCNQAAELGSILQQVIAEREDFLFDRQTIVLTGLFTCNGTAKMHERNRLPGT